MLLLKSIQFFDGFTDSYKKEGKLPPDYEDEAVRGVLIAFFCKARLYSKYLTNEKVTFRELSFTM
jgi:hypothetical protein